MKLEQDKHTHTHRQEDSPCTTGDKLSNPTPPRGGAGGEHKWLPSNSGQIYEGRSHPEEQEGPPHLEPG